MAVSKYHLNLIRRRGSPPKSWTDNITEWTELTLCGAVTRLCNLELDWIRPQRSLTKGQEEKEEEEEDWI